MMMYLSQLRAVLHADYRDLPESVSAKRIAAGKLAGNVLLIVVVKAGKAGRVEGKPAD